VCARLFANYRAIYFNRHSEASAFPYLAVGWGLALKYQGCGSDMGCNRRNDTSPPLARHLDENFCARFFLELFSTTPTASCFFGSSLTGGKCSSGRALGVIASLQTLLNPQTQFTLCFGK
jgi:hypothetical protein